MENNTFYFLTLICTAACTVWFRQKDYLSAITLPRMVTFIIFVVIGLWLLSTVDTALFANEVECRRRLNRMRICSEESDPAGFWLTIGPYAIGGILALSSGIAALLPRKSNDE